MRGVASPASSRNGTFVSDTTGGRSISELMPRPRAAGLPAKTSSTPFAPPRRASATAARRVAESPRSMRCVTVQGAPAGRISSSGPSPAAWIGPIVRPSIERDRRESAPRPPERPARARHSDSVAGGKPSARGLNGGIMRLLVGMISRLRHVRRVHEGAFARWSWQGQRYQAQARSDTKCRAGA